MFTAGLTGKVIKFGDKSVFARNGSVVVIDEKTGQTTEHTPTMGLHLAGHFAQQASVMKVDDHAYAKWQQQRGSYLRLAQALVDIAKEAQSQLENEIVEAPRTNDERELCERREEMNARIREAPNGVTHVVNLDSLSVEKAVLS